MQQYSATCFNGWLSKFLRVKNFFLLRVTLRINQKDWDFKLSNVKISLIITLSNWKEWIFTLQRVKFLFFKVKISICLHIIPSVLIDSILCLLDLNTTSIKTDCIGETLCEKIPNFTLKRLKFYFLQSENSLFTVWNFIGRFLFDWNNLNLFDWPEVSLQPWRIDFSLFL